MKLSTTLLVTSNVRRLTDFYAKLTESDSEGADGFQEFEIGGNSLAIISTAPVDAFLGGQAVAAANHSLYLGFEVEDVDAERERIRPFVDEVVLEPTTQPWGNRTLIFRDPDGNLLNLYTPVERK